jgi:chromosome segregation ATPase
MFFQCSGGEKLLPDDDQPNVERTNDEDKSPKLPPPTQKQYQDLLAEVELINKEVTTVRRQLWEAQDQLKEKDDKIRTLENHVNELLEDRQKDVDLVKELKEANTELLEQEAKARESLDLMKRVLTRAELKAKGDEETIEILKHDLRRNRTEDDAERMKQAVKEKEKRLELYLKEADDEVKEWKEKFTLANRTVINLRSQIAAMDDPTGAAKQLERQRKMIDALEQQIIDLEIEDMEREDEVRDVLDEILPQYDHRVIHRAYFDEDLEKSRVKEVLHKLNCAK